MEMKQVDNVSIDFFTNVPCAIRVSELDINLVSFFSGSQWITRHKRTKRGEGVCVLLNRS